jgi:hypothetical protein
MGTRHPRHMFVFVRLCLLMRHCGTVVQQFELARG